MKHTEGKWYVTKTGLGINNHKNRIRANIAEISCPAYEKMLKYEGVSEEIEDEMLANARRIVLCCNGWDELVNALTALEKLSWMIGNRITLAGTLPGQIETIRKQAKQALAAAQTPDDV